MSFKPLALLYFNTTSPAKKFNSHSALGVIAPCTAKFQQITYIILFLFTVYYQQGLEIVPNIQQVKDFVAQQLVPWHCW